MDVLLIEDEPPALERLAAGVRAYDPSIQIVGTPSSVVESVAWLRSHRLNRKYLAQADAVRRFRSGDKGRLLVALEPEPAEPVVVSQERAAAFRHWLGAPA